MDPTALTELTDALSHLEAAFDAVETVDGNTKPIQEAAFILRNYLKVGGGQWVGGSGSISIGAHSE